MRLSHSPGYQAMAGAGAGPDRAGRSGGGQPGAPRRDAGGAVAVCGVTATTGTCWRTPHWYALTTATPHHMHAESRPRALLRRASRWSARSRWPCRCAPPPQVLAAVLRHGVHVRGGAQRRRSRPPCEQRASAAGRGRRGHAVLRTRVVAVQQDRTTRPIPDTRATRVNRAASGEQPSTTPPTTRSDLLTDAHRRAGALRGGAAGRAALRLRGARRLALLLLEHEGGASRVE